MIIQGRLLWFGLLLTMGHVQSLFAYEVETHVRFSQKSASCSVLNDQGLMDNLGLKGLEDEDPIWREPVDTRDEDPRKWIVAWVKEYGTPKDPRYKPTIKTLIGWGAKFEDEEFKKRPLNHFFDPLDDRPLHPCLPPLQCETSPDWSLEDGIPQPDLSGREGSAFHASAHGV